MMHHRNSIAFAAALSISLVDLWGAPADSQTTTVPSPQPVPKVPNALTSPTATSPTVKAPTVTSPVVVAPGAQAQSTTVLPRLPSPIVQAPGGTVSPQPVLWGFVDLHTRPMAAMPFRIPDE